MAKAKSNSKATQKEREKIAVTKFLEDIFVGVQYEIDKKHNESPDFIVHTQEKSYGIEITEYIDEQRVEIEKIKKEIIRMCNAQFQNRLDKYHIRLYWRTYNSDTRYGGEKGKQKIVSRLVKYILHEIESGHYREYTDDDTIADEILNQFFSLITIRDQIDGILETYIGDGGDSEYLDVNEDIIKQRIDEKNVKLENEYRNKANEN